MSSNVWDIVPVDFDETHRQWARATNEAKRRPLNHYKWLNRWQVALAPYAFGHTQLYDLVEIVELLSKICHLNSECCSIYLSAGGWLNLINIRLADEPGCIEFNGPKPRVVKPRCLHIFKPNDVHFEWWYLRLELEELQPRLPTSYTDQPHEFCLQLGPDTFVDRDAYDLEYGNQENPYPENAKVVMRCLAGYTFLNLYSSGSLLNYCDFRRNYTAMPIEEFSIFVDSWRHVLAKGIDYREIYWSEVRALCQNVTTENVIHLMEILQQCRGYDRIWANEQLFPYVWGHVQHLLGEQNPQVVSLRLFAEKDFINCIFPEYFERLEDSSVEPFECDHNKSGAITCFRTTVLGLEIILGNKREQWPLVENVELKGSDTILVRYDYGQDWLIYLGSKISRDFRLFEEPVLRESFKGLSKDVFESLFQGLAHEHGYRNLQEYFENLEPED